MGGEGEEGEEGEEQEQDPDRVAVRGRLPRRHALRDRREGADQPLAVALRALLREEDARAMGADLRLRVPRHEEDAAAGGLRARRGDEEEDREVPQGPGVTGVVGTCVSSPPGASACKCACWFVCT